MLQKNALFIVLVGFLTAVPVLAQNERSEVVFVKTVVLSDIPKLQATQLPVRVGGESMLLGVGAHLYYLSETVKVEKEFADRQTMKSELRKLYCGDAIGKHTWQYKMVAENPKKDDSIDPMFNLGGENPPMLMGLLTPEDSNKKLQPEAIGRLIVSYQDSELEPSSKKGEKVDWRYLQTVSGEFNCKDDDKK